MRHPAVGKPASRFAHAGYTVPDSNPSQIMCSKRSPDERSDIRDRCHHTPRISLRSYEEGAVTAYVTYPHWQEMLAT